MLTVLITTYLIDLHTDLLSSAKTILYVVFAAFRTPILSFYSNPASNSGQSIFSKLFDNGNPWVKFVGIAAGILIIYFTGIFVKEVNDDWKLQQQQNLIEMRRLKNSTCPKISLEEFELQKKHYTNKQL